MITLRGKVIGVKGDLLEVELQENNEICKSCHARGLCGVNYEKRRIQAKNKCDAQKNNIVSIKLNPNNPLKLAFIFYIVPLIIFFILYFLFTKLNLSLQYAFICALIGFAVFYVVIFFAGKNRRIYDKFLPIAVEKQN